MKLVIKLVSDVLKNNNMCSKKRYNGLEALV